MKPHRNVVNIFELLASVLVFAACDYPPSYLEILNRSEKYYFELAGTCNELLVNTNYVASPNIIRGDDASLPKRLKTLHATKIEIRRNVMVGTNDISEVLVIFGEGRPDYIVTWKHGDYGNGNRPWQLAVVGEGGVGKTVFSTTNLSVFNTTK